MPTIRLFRFLTHITHVPTVFWWDVLIVVILILFDISIHALGPGPDRLVHDPAVYRLWDPSYLPGDWYTGMAVGSGIYIFYAKLVNAWHFLGISEERWRIFLYLASLALLYYSLIRIGRLFLKNMLVAPVIALLSAKIYRPEWLYGPFIQLDGGFAPRSIGTSLSFLALYFLLKGSLFTSAVVLGVATLFHASNSLIVFTLFLAAWAIHSWFTSKHAVRQRVTDIGRKAGLAIGTYLLAGGWFALYVFTRSSGGTSGFPPEQFIWVWTHLRAVYLALPYFPLGSWLYFAGHIAAMLLGWLLLRKKVGPVGRGPLNLLAFIGIGSVVYFFLFYLFAFVWPWLPGFQFYSIRAIYFAYFATFFFVGLFLIYVGQDLISMLLRKFGKNPLHRSIAIALLAITIPLGLFWFEFRTFPKRSVDNFRSSLTWLENSRLSVAEMRRDEFAQQETVAYLISNPEPFLAPPSWNNLYYYLPSVANMKSFGFTSTGLPEWYERIDDVSRGEIQEIYERQVQTGKFQTITLDWESLYSGLTVAEVVKLSEKYHFGLFLTYKEPSYPFPLIAEDDTFRLYQIPATVQR